MKKGSLLKSLTIASGVFCFFSEATPTWVEIPVTKLFVPMGFDSNDNTQVIVSGALPNHCYKSPTTTAVVEEGVAKITVKALYEGSEGLACAEAQIPFLEKVSLNLLDAGEYSVKANLDTPQLLEEKLVIKQAASVNVNDHVYAGVDYVQIQENSRVVVLNLYTTSDCFEFDRIEEISNAKDAFSVQPIMKKIRPFCPRKIQQFQKEYTVPEGMTADEILLHVRTMQGDSVNVLFPNVKTEESR